MVKPRLVSVAGDYGKPGDNLPIYRKDYRANPYLAGATW